VEEGNKLNPLDIRGDSLFSFKEEGLFKTKMKMLNRKGQSIVAGVGGILTAAVLIYIGIILLGSFQSTTTGKCVLANTTEVNSTTLDGALKSHGFLLSGYMNTASREQTPKIEVTYVAGSLKCNVTYSDGTWIANLDGTTPDQITLGTAKMPDSFLNYTSCGTTNVTKTNLTYYQLSVCDYTEDAYNALESTSNISFTSMGILPIAILVMAAILVIGVLMLLGRNE
jgi:hypothetical protein